MKRALILALLSAATAPSVFALHNMNLEQKNAFLPRDQYLDLVTPDKVNTQHVVVQFIEDTRVRLVDGRLVSLEGLNLDKFNNFLANHPEIRIRRNITSKTVEEVDAWIARGEELSGVDLVDMNNFYTLEIHATNQDPKGLLEELLSDSMVETCYYHPLVQLATCNADVAPTTGNYFSQQDYLDPAPGGVDMNYAWNFSSYGNGSSGNWIMDIENDWCSNHEDMNDTFSITNWDGSNNDADGDHGTAVMGIVGACNNGFGVTGMVHDNTMRAWSWSGNGDPYPDVSDSIAGVEGPMITGDTYLIEIHAPGPSQGTTCTCNCGQFEYIAMEYWSANFNAIAANTANGLYCAQAAGNGSMNLDSAVYGGAFNRNVRDSGAVIVGAATDDATHDPTCWTNHGTRIDLYGWGQNVETLGYGDRFDGVGGNCAQEYTAGFSGTSSATPIVAGTMASLALIHRYGDAAAWMSPTTLRSRLQINGTPQATDFTRELNVMPNLKGVLAPDLEPYPAGWDDDIVAKISTAAPDGEIPASALVPAPATSYIDWKWINSSYYSTAATARSAYYLDDVLKASGTYTNLPPNTFTFVREYATAVRGGRHLLSQRCDDLSVLDEGDETDNNSYAAYVWEGTTLAEDTPTSFTRAPKSTPTNYSYFSCDGYYNGGSNYGFWDVWAVCANDGSSNYDIRMHAEVPTATTGFGANVAYSALSTSIDFVGTNANGGSDGDRVGVLNPSDSSSGYTIEGDGSTYLGTPTATPVLDASGNLDVNELVDVYEVHLTSGSPVQFILNVCSGNADVVMTIFRPSQQYFTRSAATATINANGQGLGEETLFTPTETGYHAVVISKNTLADLSRNASYELIWGDASIGDLTHGVYSNWDDDIVVRVGGSIGVEPSTINPGNMVVDAGYTNISSSGTFQGGSNTSFTLNGPTVYTTGNFIPFSPLLTSFTSNNPLGPVIGGRYEIGVHLDTNSEVTEISEVSSCLNDNNHAWERYVVVPQPLTSQSPQTIAAAPNYRDTTAPSTPGGNFMQHGFSVDPTSWSFIAATVTDVGAGEGLNIHAYDYHATGVSTPLLDPVSNSIGADNQVVYVGVNGLSALGVKDVGINNHQTWQSEPSTSTYRVNYCDRIATLAPTGTNGPYDMNSGFLVHSYSIYMYSGSTYDVIMDIMSGTADLGLAVYPAGLQYTDMGDAVLTLNSGGGGVDESGSFVASTTGWYGIAVYKTSSADLNLSAQYRLRFNAPGAPMPITDLQIVPDELDTTDGTIYFHYTFTPVTQDVNGSPIAVDHYDLYYAFDPYASFPAGWTYYSSYAGSPTPSIPHATLEKILLRMVAVDTDGFVITSDAGTTGKTLRSEELRSLSRKAEVGAPIGAPIR
ncbi:MAG: hypothetical protein H6678_11340 [Candidatus Delongbacteria bacterium]|nr:hypothetical protein [Candidatus Delongbacteria bacterium]